MMRKVQVEFSGYTNERCEVCNEEMAGLWWTDEDGVCSLLHAHLKCITEALRKRYGQVQVVAQRFVLEVQIGDEEAPQLEP